jgi:hypothetical protein
VLLRLPLKRSRLGAVDSATERATLRAVEAD